ncbi:MAG: Nif3-like dinuclear metal center hexameric protein [Clostridia bacterium]|nr:Nif3-like dinuclear metal center hexameric protein [Clostridia bacterium]
MATVKDVIALMEEIAPKKLSDLYCQKYNAYDNSGLLLGNEDKQVFSVLVCLDLTSEVAAEAQDINADMIITHHPLIFGGLNEIISTEPMGKILYKLIQNNIAVYAAHLNFDFAPFGINQILADKLMLYDCKVMQEIGEEAGLGRIGKIEKCTLKDFYDTVISTLCCENIRVSGNFDKIIHTVAVISGSGGGDIELLNIAAEHGADLILTSEVKHHIALAAKELDIAVIDAGHYSTENIAISMLVDALNGYAENKNLDIEVVQTAVNTNPFEF